MIYAWIVENPLLGHVKWPLSSLLSAELVLDLVDLQLSTQRRQALLGELRPGQQDHAIMAAVSHEERRGGLRQIAVQTSPRASRRGPLTTQMPFKCIETDGKV